MSGVTENYQKLLAIRDAVVAFNDSYNAWLDTQLDEDGEPIGGDYSRLDEGRADWGDDALLLLESLERETHDA